MTRELIVLVEEESMKALLDGLLPRILQEGWHYKVIPHQGKSDLERSIPRKLRAWRRQYARFIVMRDNDRGDCRARKRALMDRVDGTGRESATKVRIVSQELEAWILGDIPALEAVKGRVSAQIRRLAQNPDSIDYPVRLRERHYGSYPKVASAREIAPHMEIGRNLSPSFRAFMAAVRELTDSN